MPLFGNIIVIKRNGTDGISFPLTASSCLFGRRTECDIRIQLPQVSKEHCKIEVNENKEAILTNLSTVNPTQLNGGCFQQPVPLKHGDVLTIIDRSFRFEYPRQSTPRKGRSRSPKDETLQVLHVQQVAEMELLHQQTPGSKSLHVSDDAEFEEKNANEIKQSTEENTSKALPIKLQTPKSSCRIHQIITKKNEKSPFTKLYEKLKYEIQVKNFLYNGNASQEAAKEDGKSVPLEPSAQILSSSCVHDLGNLTEEKGIGRSEKIEECKIKQKVNSLEFNEISAAGSATNKSFTRSPQTSVSEEISRDTGKSHLQGHKELSPAEKPNGTEVTSKPSKENDGNAAFPLELCPVECLDHTDTIKTHSSAIALDEQAQTANMTNVSEVDKYLLSTPTPRRKSSQSHFISPTRETSGMNPVNNGTPTTRRRVSSKRKSLSEISAETEREDSVSRNDSLKQLPLAEDKCLKQRQNSKQHTPGKPVEGVVLKEICDQANSVNSKEGHSETPASLSKSRSPRRNNRQNDKLSNKSVHSETLASEELMSELASPASQKPDSGRRRSRWRTSVLLTEKVLEADAVQEHHKTADGKDKATEEELVTKEYHQKQDLEDASVIRPRRLPSMRRSSGSVTVLKDNEAVSEVNISGLLPGEESGKTKRVSRKRKSGDLLLQPLGNRKRVSFGGQLSPELFDKSLPANSPLKKGATPARLSLPMGNSPRAVLKKAQGLKCFAAQELSEHWQKEKMSPKNLPAQKSPAASSPASGKATSRFTSGSPEPYTQGRFSVSHITALLPIAEEKDAVAEDMNTKEKTGAWVKTSKCSDINQDDKTFLTATPEKLTSAQFASKITPMKSRSGALAVINAKRRSGASTANLLVAKSWAEVVKLGVVRPQSKTRKKSVRKGRPLKKKTQSPKAPERKIKDHFSTGHAESPATIVVGRAYSTTVRAAGQVPKVVKNPILKPNMNMDESFTGMTEMFQTPENKSGKMLPLATVQKTDFTPTCTAVDTSELHTPEESGEMMVSPLNSSDGSEQKQDSPGISSFLRGESLKSMSDAISTKTEKRKSMLEESVSVDNLSIIPEKEASRVKSGSKRRTSKQKLKPIEAMSDIKQLLRTPEQSSEPIEALSGIRQLMETPKRKLEPVEALSGIKKLMRSPKQKSEPVEALSGIRQLMKTPKQKSEPVEPLSGIRQLMKTPKQKSEPVEALSGIRQLMRTPKQKSEPVEALSGIRQLMKTPKQKSEPVEALSGIRQLMRTPKQKSEPVEALSGIRQLMRTPKQKSEPVEALSGIRQLMRTPKQKSEPVEALSGIRQLMRTPKQKSEPVEALSGIRQLMRTPKQKSEPVEALSGIKQLMKTPKQKSEPVEALSGIKQLMRTPKQKSEPVEALSGIKQLMRTPKQKSEPVEALSGIKQLMRTPKQKSEPVEALSGIKQLMRTPKQELETVTDEITDERLLKAPVQERGAVKDVAGLTLIKKSPKVKYQPVEDMIGVSRIFKTPKEKVEPVEDMFGISRLVKTPREKHQPVDDFVGLQRLMAEPRGRCSDSELDYVGVTEMFDIPEEIKTKSVSVTDSRQEDTAPLCTNSSHKYDVLDNEGNIPQGKDSRQKESTREDQTTQILTRGRSRKTTHPASAKQCEKDLNLKELQSLGKKNTQEEMGEISNSTSGAKNEGRRTRTNSLIQEEIVSKHPLQEKVVVVQFVESHGATQGPGRGKRENPKEIRHPSENLESCSKDSSVLQKEPDNMKQALQECSINDTLSTEDDPAIKTANVSRNIQNESCQLQTGLIKGENKSSEGGVEDSEEMFLLPGKRSKRVKEKENTEPVALPKRGRAKNTEVKQAFSEDLHETARKLRSDLSAKMIKTDEQAFDKDTETATAEESENGSKHEIKITGKRVKSLRSARKHSVEVKADVCGTALENIQNIQKNEEIETDTETQSHVKNKIKVSQGDETDNAQESTTEASQRLKAESPGEINKMPVTALNLEANRSAVQGTNRTRNRRGKKDSLEKKADEFAKDVNNLEIMTPNLKSEMEMDKSLKDSLGFVCGKNTYQVMKDQNNPAATSVPAANSDSLALSPEKRTRNEHRILEAKQTEILQENQAQKNGMACRRGRSRKVNFELEVSSRAVGGKRSLPGNDKGMTYEGGQHETSENPSSQVRKSRRKQVDSVPQITCSRFVEKQTLIADHSKVEAFVKEQDSALEATPSSMEDNPLRRGKRREVAAASQTSRSLSIRKRHGLLEGDDKKMTVREDQNPALGNKTSQTKANASARGKRKTIDPATEEKLSSLRRKRGLSETESKEEGANEAQNMSLGRVSCAKEKPLGRGRRKETALTSHTTNYISLRGKHGLPTDNGRVEVAKEGVPLENLSSSVKENQLRTGRRNEIALLLEASNCTIQGKQDLSKESGRNNNYRKGKNLILGSSASQEKNDLSKRNSRQATTSLAVSSISLRGLPEGGKNETPEEQENVLLEGAPCARENPSRADRKKTISSKSEETSSAFLREKPGLLEGRGQRKILEDENTSLENNSSQGKTRQLRNRREKVEFKSEAATSTSVCKEGDLPENSNTLETQNVCLTSTGSEKNNQSGKGKEVNPIQQATSTSRRRKCQLPEDDLASKKLKSENDEDRSLQTGKRNKTKEDVKVTQAAGGTDRKTRSSARTRK
ncbi:proliferation marker protein Ki-67 isoform X1 [Falco cherrug]|uniref:proliferation marker protein Ki-67 isoform X1 n=1 Tax=Falco cherrug TaxID=345164 RepID=UPI0024799913|nr:proliferation marker protein Ki-67 isoform X1 [Falco cherrug]XP_055575922.1 proliferation marker protein Ki-67 isoform X1 [Falco cherrug]XP_055575923.1 proliferation marker protein Ki-67 isoform X1 [Falco cherrug]